MVKRKNNLVIILILSLFTLIKTFHLLAQKGILWDTAVYLGMGKYIFSLGKIGLWEPARPLILPFLLGILWKLNINPIISGRIIILLSSIGCIYLTYLIGKKVFNKETAIISTILLALSSTFLFYSSTILTGVPSTFFALLTIYFALNKKYLFTGLFAGLAISTRFLQLFALIPLAILLILQNKKKIKNTLYGFLIILIPYLVINTFLYKNPLYPFIFQTFMTQNTGWVYHQPLSFYFINLLKENLLILFTIPSMIFIFKKPNKKRIQILSIFLLFFIFFNSTTHKETRFMLVFLPYLYLIAAYGITKTIKINSKKKLYLLIIMIFIISLAQTLPQLKTPSYQEYNEFTSYIKNTDGNIWISNPIFISKSNKKAEELMYYPIFNSKRIDELNKLPQASNILIDTCDILPCPPSDKKCNKKAQLLITLLKKEFNTILQEKKGSCEKFIFKKTTSSP